MTNVTEIAPDVYRISTYNDNYKLQFNQFLVKDDESLLFHTGMKGDFPLIREAVARIVDPATICWLSFSHFESDECGSLNEWLEAAPQAQPLCTVVAALVNLSDFAIRAPRWIQKEEAVNTGKYRFRLYPMPICLTPGMRACSSRRRAGRYSVRTCSSMGGMWSRSPNPTWSEEPGRRWSISSPRNC